MLSSSVAGSGAENEKAAHALLSESVSRGVLLRVAKFAVAAAMETCYILTSSLRLGKVLRYSEFTALSRALQKLPVAAVQAWARAVPSPPGVRRS